VFLGITQVKLHICPVSVRSYVSYSGPSEIQGGTGTLGLVMLMHVSVICK
jgi:hypothetical protein